MSVVKFKPGRSPRILDTQALEVQENTRKAVQRSEDAVIRSKQLVKKSKEVIAAAKKHGHG